MKNKREKVLETLAMVCSYAQLMKATKNRESYQDYKDNMNYWANRAVLKYNVAHELIKLAKNGVKPDKLEEVIDLVGGYEQ